ncbi:MAG: metal-dependent hydrolase [Rhodobacteraceae bacterium]|nr:MAG: metal-dependent hydrolase [Paracoccaceae bacterium]
MNPDQPQAQAVAVKDGIILAVGNTDQVVAAHKGADTQIVDVAGKTLLPGFIDPHSHFINALGMSVQANVSAPPVGPASNPTEIVAELKRYFDGKPRGADQLFMGYGYDENLMPEGQRLTRYDLDKEFPDTPVLIMHVSLHGVVLNSAAMAKYGIDANTETPPGGVILRVEGSNEPEGLLMETAFLPIFEQLPSPGPDEVKQQILDGQMIYARAGVTTGYEGATHLSQLNTLKDAADQGLLFMDVIALPFITDLEKTLAEYPVEEWMKYDNNLKIGGCKITEDGSPQGKTAFFTTPYLTGGPSGETNWKGEPTFAPEMFNKMVKTCYDLGVQLYVHTNGDAAGDLTITAHELAAADDLDADRRTVVVHSQFVRTDQLEKYVEYNLIPSFYTEHTFFFSAAHEANRGPEQTARLSPMREAIDMGLKPTNHTDFNVVPIDQMFVLWTAVTRKNRNGRVIGPDQRITPYEALEAITVNAAYQAFEEDSKGSIEIGKRADLVVLDANPLTVEPDALKDITVLRTIKDGKTIYAATQTANPAATFCVESGGTYETRDSDAGAIGICILADGTEVDAWAYFRAQKS